LKPVFRKVDLSFKDKSEDVPSWEMSAPTSDFNNAISEFIRSNKKQGTFVSSVFLEMHAVGLMLNYIYRVERKATIPKSNIYQGFFKAPFIANYCDRNGIEAATDTGAEHRCPFLLNILEALGVIKQDRSDIEVLAFVVTNATMQIRQKESDKDVLERIDKFLKDSTGLSSEEISLLRELFGKDFLTAKYHLKQFKRL
jgi:hypothetical protein